MVSQRMPAGIRGWDNGISLGEGRGLCRGRYVCSTGDGSKEEEDVQVDGLLQS